MNIGYLIPLVCFWQTISSQIAKYKPPAIANNMVSFIHCLSFIGHYNYDYNMGYAIHISIGFFFYDLLYIFSLLYRTPIKDEVKRHAPFIIHHVAGIYVLNAALSGEGREHILYAYNILEKSNIMLYISYYVRKQYAEHLKLNAITDFIQLLSYSYYRLVALSLFIYTNSSHFFQFHFMTQFLIIGIYSMGYAWSHRLLKKNIANYNTLLVACSKK
jgi:hypothetical protein